MKQTLLLFVFAFSLMTQLANANHSPGWILGRPLEISPSVQNELSNKLHSATSMRGSFNANSFSMLMGGEPVIAEEITPEISRLAASLGNDPVKIYSFVKNKIKYVHYFGSKKGAHVTLLERSGNDFDQSALLVALLRAAGENSESVYEATYEFGMMKIPYQAPDGYDLRNWLGFYYTQNSMNYYEIFETLNRHNHQQNYPYYYPAYQWYAYILMLNDDDDRFALHRVWVSFNDGTNTYKLDPAFKTSTLTLGLDLSTAVGFDTAQVINAVTNGASITTNYVQNLGESNLQSVLSGYTEQLLTYMQTNSPHLTVEEAVGGYRINEIEITSLPTTNAFEVIDGTVIVRNNSPQELPFSVIEWENIPSLYMYKLRLKAEPQGEVDVDGLDVTYDFPGLKGAKVGITFDEDARLTVSLNDQVDVQGNVVNATNYPNSILTTEIIHTPYYWDWENEQIESFGDPHSHDDNGRIYMRSAFGYAITVGFDDPKVRLQEHQKRLDQYIKQGYLADSPEVVTESLQIIGLSWIQQKVLIQSIVGMQNGVQFLTLSMGGRVGYESGDNLGYYVDMPLNYLTPTWVMNNPTNSSNPIVNVMSLSSFLASALEHGVIEQLQNNPSASTVKVVANANAAGKKILLASTNNWSSLQTYLDSEALTEQYTSGVRDYINALLQGGFKVLMPSNAEIGVGNDWKGYGLAALTKSFSSMLISGNYNGGYAGNQEELEADLILQFLLDTRDNRPPTQPHTMGADPVNLRDGSFSLKSTDLLAGRSFPRGLNFGRIYNSGANQRNEASMANGWTHNYMVRAYGRTDAASGLGSTIPQHMASTIIGVKAAYAVFTSTPNSSNPEVLLWTTTALISEWTVDHLKDNAVMVEMGGDSMQFVRQATPAGSIYQPPVGVTSTLTMATNGAFVLQERHGNTLTFGTNHWLSTITDPHGKSMSFSYDAEGLLTNIQDSYLRTHTLNYTGVTPNKRLISVMEGDGTNLNIRAISFGYSTNYNADGDLVSFTDPEGKTWTFEYDENHRITKTKDPIDRTIVINEYDEFDRVYQQHSQGDTNKTWQFVYSPFETMEINPEGDFKVYLYDEKSRLQGVQNELGNRNWLYYDGHDHLVRQVSAEGREMRFDYDANHNVTNVIKANGPVWTWVSSAMIYDNEKRLHRVRDFEGLWVLTNEYNLQHQLVKVSKRRFNNSTITNIAEFGYYTNDTATGKAGDLDWAEGTDKNRTYFEYDSFGFVNRSVMPSLSGVNNVTWYTNNYRGDRTGYLDARTNATRISYNSRRQAIQVIRPGNLISSMEYDDIGNLWKVADSKTNITEFLYSVTGKLLKTKLPQVNGVIPEVENTYDNRDWLAWVEDPLNARYSYTYDRAGHVLSVEDPLSRTTVNTYTQDGLLESVTSPLASSSQTTTFIYNVRGELESTIDALGNRVTSLYDDNGRMTTLSNRLGKRFTFEYYSNGQLNRTRTPTLKQTLRSYDTNGLIRTVTEPSLQLTTYGYDKWRQLKTIKDDVTGSTPASLNYDSVGNLVSHTQGTKTISYAYDNLNRITNYAYVDTANTSHNYSLGYQYDENSNMAGIIYPDGRRVAYTYDAHNRLETVTDWAGRQTTYLYDLAGRNTDIFHHNGTRRKITHNSTGQATSIQELNPTGVPIALFNYGHDTAGRVYEEFIAPIPAGYTEPNRTVTYDNDNQIVSFNGTTLNYDSDGNMRVGPLTNNSFVTYTYDSRNRLTATAATNPVPAMAYGYDQNGNRITVSQASQVTKYVVNPIAGLSQILVRTKPDGSKTFYVYGLGLVYEVDDQRTLTYHYDSRGSTVALTSPSGEVVHRVEYSVYGMITYRSGGVITFDTPFLFNGRYGVQTDANGLLYMRARYYNPYITRFINADPIKFTGGLNWYAFVDGNPVSLVDPFGLSALDTVIGGFRVVGGIFETAAGYTLAVAAGTFGVVTAPTVGGAVVGAAGFVGGAAIGAHGIDQIQAGIRQMFSGEHVESLTSVSLQSAGMSPSAANLTDAGISLVGSFGAGYAATGFRAATLSTTASTEVANASILTQIKYYEAGQTSFESEIFMAKYANIQNTLDRGAAILEEFGSLWGVWKAGSQSLGIAQGTLKYLPTPMANGALGSGFGFLGTGLPSIVGHK